MAFDFAVLDLDGTPEKAIPVGVDLHHELVTHAAACKLARLMAFSDYYEDAEIAVCELEELAIEIHRLREQTTSIKLQRLLDDLSELVAYALDCGRSLYGISD